MNLRLLLVFLFLCCFTAIKCWVEMDIAGNDLSRPNAKFVKMKDEECNEGEDGEESVGGGHPRHPIGGGRRRGGRKGRRGRGRAGRGRQLDPGADNSNDDGQGDDSPKKSKGRKRKGPKKDDSDEECDFPTSPKSVVELPQKPRLRMIKRKKETGKEKVERQKLEVTECTEIINDMAPKTSIKIETYTIPYTVNQVKYRTVTRKILYVQRRRKIKRTLNKPIVIIKRKVIKEKQIFERIVPKVIETREIINKPSVEYKVQVIEEPMEVVGEPDPDDTEEECDSAQTPPYDAPHRVDEVVVPDIPMNPEQPGPSASGIQVGYDFAAALNTGINAAFAGGAHAEADGVVVPNNAPNMRSLEYTTPCPLGLVNNGLGSQSAYVGQPANGQGSNVYANSRTNAYGQPVLSFSKK